MRKIDQEGAIDDHRRQTLESKVSPMLGARPYRLVPYPRIDELEPERALAEVFVWRAGILDFLADVWDVMGTPEFSVDECELQLALGI